MKKVNKINHYFYLFIITCRYLFMQCNGSYKMNPTIRKLSKSVQSIICAANQINNYTKAVQELVYNSLDADATSIAVRIHIAEGSIQVIDNGCGVSQADYKYIGQRYMTSNLVDISTLKSAPNKYGFQGQSLANLSQISETLKITSRHSKCETTYAKTFENGKAKSTVKCSPRPSKGTTIEIKGFLYNLSIQKKSVDPINELQNIKTFLEHISLVHFSISLSLRDDSKNEIVFKIHKNRDIYQTLSTLYEIDKTKVQELQVEKNNYKVKAYVGKSSDDVGRQFIFLNGKFIHHSSVLHKKLSDDFKRHFKENQHKIKKNVVNTEENHIFENRIPFYFLFISCPYMDYQFTNTVLEFKNLGQINMLLDKLIKFYHGEVQIKTNSENKIKGLCKKHETESTKNEIEKIMRKILGSHFNKPQISNMQNGIKGKLIKRKPKTKKSLLNLSKIIDINQCNMRHNIPKQISSDKTKKNKQRADKDRSDFKTPSKISEVINLQQKQQTASASIKTLRKPNKRNKHKKMNRKHTDSSNVKNKKSSDATVGTIHVTTKPNKKLCTRNKLLSLSNKFAMETESVKRRCELLAQKTRELIENRRNPKEYINENSHYICNTLFENANVAIHKKINEIVIREYFPLPPKSNIDVNERNYGNKKSFKSNYDLLQTVISGLDSHIKQKENVDALNGFIPAIVELNNDMAVVDEPDLTQIPPSDSITPHSNHVNLSKELNDLSQYNAETPSYSFRPFIREPDRMSPLQVMMRDSNKRHDNKEFGNFTPVQTLSPYINISKTGARLPFSAARNDIDSMPLVMHSNDDAPVSPLQAKTFNSNNLPFSARVLDTSPFQAETFQSHNYYNYQRTESDAVVNKINKKPRNFITKQSRDNFLKEPVFKKKITFRNNKLKSFSKLFRFSNDKRNWNIPVKMFDMKNNTVKGTRESYTIEFTESNKYSSLKNNCRHGMYYSDNNVTYENIEAITPSMSYIFSDSVVKSALPMDTKACFTTNDYTNDVDYEPINGNTFTITNSYRNIIPVSVIQETWNNHETYTIDRAIENHNKQLHEHETTDPIENSDTEFVNVSKSQENIDERQSINPIDVCETILQDHKLSIDKAREFDTSFNCRQDSLKKVNMNMSSNNPQNELNNTMVEFTNIKLHGTQCDTRARQKTTQDQDFEEVSHHFTIPNSLMSEFRQSLILKTKGNEELVPNAQNQNKDMSDVAVAADTLIEKNNTGAFNMKSRLFYVPKGMSPMFEECPTKHDCGTDLNEDYYEDDIYNNFVEDVQNNAKIFKSGIRVTNDQTTKDKSKVNDKMNKENASIKFDGFSIKNAKVLAQIDSKFIGATMKSRSADDEEFLVLFDQHAVHERIRLENNLADYLSGSQWKSVAIDEVSLKMSRDEALYLHNYRDKFMQFGLEWKILDYNEISLTAIPEGILGKNPRQVEKILKAVKGLIKEEINNIQMQRGCVSLYPKSIMDLVFSEACRYAIKFGDRLSKSQCVELLNELSNCKTPFQCAHGRPAMAVIMNIERNQADYKIHIDKIENFKKNLHVGRWM